MALTDIVPATGNRTVGTVLSDLFNGEQSAASGFDPRYQTQRQAQMSRIEKMLLALTADEPLDADELAELKDAARAGAEAALAGQADEIAAAVVAALPEDGRPLSKADVADAVRSVFAAAGTPQA